MRRHLQRLSLAALTTLMVLGAQRPVISQVVRGDDSAFVVTPHFRTQG